MDDNRRPSTTYYPHCLAVDGRGNKGIIGCSDASRNKEENSSPKTGICNRGVRRESKKQKGEWTGLDREDLQRVRVAPSHRGDERTCRVTTLHLLNSFSTDTSGLGLASTSCCPARGSGFVWNNSPRRTNCSAPLFVLWSAQSPTVAPLNGFAARAIHGSTPSETLPKQTGITSDPWIHLANFDEGRA